MASPTILAALDTFQRAANRGTAVYLSPELVQQLRDVLEARPDADALAARPLLEEVAAMADCIGAQTVGQITAISNRAAAWLRENPPGQPVAIEPRGCPTPGACSCVEPAPPAPEQGDAWWHELINEIARVQHVAQGEGQGPRFDLAKAVELSRRPTPPAPEPGEAKKLHPLWYLVEFLEGHSSFRRRTEPLDELAEILSNSATLLQQQATELAALRRVPVAGISDEHRKAVCTAIAEALGEAYDCQRVWSAWSYGTMGPDDFTLTAEDDDRVAEIADAAIEVIGNFAMQTEVTVGEQLRIVKAGIRAGYNLGHHHTVEGGWGDPDEVADDIAQETLDDLGPLPAPQAGEVQP